MKPRRIPKRFKLLCCLFDIHGNKLYLDKRNVNGYFDNRRNKLSVRSRAAHSRSKLAMRAQRESALSWGFCRFEPCRIAISVRRTTIASACPPAPDDRDASEWLIEIAGMSSLPDENVFAAAQACMGSLGFFGD
jgi:hypothetical protein